MKFGIKAHKKICMFPTLKLLTERNNTTIPKDVNVCILSRLSFLKLDFENYISNAELETFDWIRNPFDT
jgi:hypothetical protein